jgi:HEAT repeat protein
MQARLADSLATDADARVRSAALGALVRRGSAAAARLAVTTALGDSDAGVRRRATELSVARDDRALIPALLGSLRDPDPLVVETAAWALGEFGEPSTVEPLTVVARDHDDPLAREAAVAALGAIGDPTALPTILAATTDKPAIRRRAVLALAPFDGPEVDAALRRALDDRDWQVRQAAEDLLG